MGLRIIDERHALLSLRSGTPDCYRNVLFSFNTLLHLPRRSQPEIARSPSAAPWGMIRLKAFVRGSREVSSSDQCDNHEAGPKEHKNSSISNIGAKDTTPHSLGQKNSETVLDC